MEQEKQEQKLTPIKSLEILEQATGAVQANRETHIVLLAAVECLKKLVDDCEHEGCAKKVVKKKKI